MDILKAVEVLWPILAGGCTVTALALIWFIRLESAVKANKSEHDTAISSVKDRAAADLKSLDEKTNARISNLEREVAEHKVTYAKGKDDVWLQMRELNASMSDIKGALSRIEGRMEGKGT